MFNRTTRKARRNIARMNERDPGAGDRAVTCLVGNPSGGVTGTLKDAAR